MPCGHGLELLRERSCPLVGFLRKGGVRNGESEAGAEIPTPHPVRHFIVTIEKELAHPQVSVLKNSSTIEKK